jgi:anti-sigma factor ChrR (cupin superfamily)
MNPALPDDIAALLHGALAPEPAPAADAALKRRLLRAIAAEATPQHLTVPADGGDWHPFGPGLQRKVLHEADGIMSYLVRLAPGARLPAHRHPVDEECVVLEGEVQIGALRVAAGGFHLGRRDLPHDRLRSEGGALIFLRGATPEPAHLL